MPTVPVQKSGKETDVRLVSITHTEYTEGMRHIGQDCNHCHHLRELNLTQLVNMFFTFSLLMVHLIKF